MAKLIIRLRSAEGQARVEVDSSESIGVLFGKVAKALSVSINAVSLSRDQNFSQPIRESDGKSIADLHLRNGDILHVRVAPDAMNEDMPKAANFKNVKQDPVDDLLEKQVGTITRKRDPKLCKHGVSGMCEYCMPVQPWDSKYLEENKIKHLSYHAYLRQLTDQSKTAPIDSAQFIPPLDEIDMKVKVPCPGRVHESWPNGICTKCQPSAITLQSQNFRMVDHIEFETAGMIETFLKFWRSTGAQRFGYLYGHYEPYAEVPLGVKAVVSVIYEPPQEGSHDGIQLHLPNEEEETVDQLAQELGLIKVGMIYTDLTDDGSGKGTVLCKRHSDSYFLSSAESIFSAQSQLKYPTASKWSATGQYGSRFVTCVMTGNEDGGIDISSFQVSNTAMAMVRDELIEASVEPSLMHVKPSTNEQYVPEVFYKYKNHYGLMIQQAARPTFPVEYLLVTVTHGFPQNPNPTFRAPNAFPVENRGHLESQDPSALLKHLSTGLLSDALSDFHALYYLKKMHVVEPAELQLINRIVKTNDQDLANQLVQHPSWQTLLAVLRESGHGAASEGNFPVTASSSSAGASSSSSQVWSCNYCTFKNTGSTDGCAMCGLPKS
ncbi:NPL4 family-domain-containing protein [Phlyctochytrium arcticum]|nr:NPL4 family-domain-containing protein [Phlyctochytrium arcticum]